MNKLHESEYNNLSIAAKQYKEKNLIDVVDSAKLNAHFAALLKSNELSWGDDGTPNKDDFLALRANTGADLNDNNISFNDKLYLININSKTCASVEDHYGTWSAKDVHLTEYGDLFFLMEHDRFGDYAASIIVDKKGERVCEDVFDGFNDDKFKMHTAYLSTGKFLTEKLQETEKTDSLKDRLNGATEQAKQQNFNKPQLQQKETALE